MHKNIIFDLDQTLLDFHASERKALEIVVTKNGLKFTDEVYDHFKAKNKSLWLELEKGTINRTELFTIISEHSGQPYEKVAADGERDFWMTAKEAMEYGMVDQILTKK